ncbi:MAG: hypothetical protein S4CHLAM20_12300 [Chlamydiia bacterium]|nr:hypothetical protein [Chlamydiia bacterium]
MFKDCLKSNFLYTLLGKIIIGEEMAGIIIAGREVKYSFGKEGDVSACLKRFSMMNNLPPYYTKVTSFALANLEGVRDGALRGYGRELAKKQLGIQSPDDPSVKFLGLQFYAMFVACSNDMEFRHKKQD